MSALVAEPRGGAWGARARDAQGREPRARSLAELVAGAWEGLRYAGIAACPVCGGRLEHDHASVSGDAASGSCRDCGCTLS